MKNSLPAGYRLRGATPEDEEKVLELLELVFGTAHEYFASIYRNYPGSTPEHSRIVVKGGEIAAHVHAFPCEFWMDGVRCPGMMIGDVATHPERRRLGLGAALLADAREYCHQHYGSSFALLLSGHEKFYGSVGWEPLPIMSCVVKPGEFDTWGEVAVAQTFLSANVAGRNACPTLGRDALAAAKQYNVRRFERAEELDTVAHIYREFNWGRSLSVNRTKEYWRRHFTWSSHHELEPLFLVAETKGEVVAYSRSSADWVKESCCLPGHEPAALALFESTMRQMRLRKVESAVVLLPTDHVVMKMLAGASGATERIDRSHWLHGIDWPALVGHFPGIFDDRLAKAGRGLEKPVTLSLGGQLVRIREEKGKTVVSEGKGKADAALAQLDAFRLVTGAARGSSVVEDRRLGELLDCLFAPCAPMFWRMDVV